MATTEIKNEMQSESICRLCLTKGEHHQLIFTGDRSALSEWIENLTTLKITENPNVPASLCLECEITLQNFESFREMCLTNDQVYKDMFTKDYSKNDHMAASNETLLVNEVKVANEEYQETDILDTGISQEYVSEFKMEYPNIGTEVVTTINSQENIGDEIKECTVSCDTETTKNKARSKPTERKKKSSVCKICGKVCSTYSKLTVHMRSHTKEKPFKCNECGKTFTQRGCLKRHELLHTDIRPFACDMCPAKFTLSSYLNWHKRIHDEGYKRCTKKDRKKKCAMPHAQVPHASVLHASVPHAPVPLAAMPHASVPTKYTKKGREKQCPFCKEFVLSLPLHYRTAHKEIRRYQCQYCPKAFNTQTRLTVHIRRHTNEKPYVCSHCDKGFASSIEMKLHEKIHLHDKPYKCDTCNKGFTTKQSLQRHMLIHSKIKPFTCDICQSSFTLKQGLRQHLRVHRVRQTQTSSTNVAAETESSHDTEDVNNFQRLTTLEISYR